jgi:REP element-mobilizing transposase RayT
MKGGVIMKALPERKSNRLEGYDYSRVGCYYITICAIDKLPLFSRIHVGDIAAGGPFVELTTIGSIVKKYLENINLRYNDVTLSNYVIMPNHVHMIMTVRIGTPRAASPTKSYIPAIINALKSLSSKECGKPIWQRGYYDHIIRDDIDFGIKYEYIETNPVRWTDDMYFICDP